MYTNKELEFINGSLLGDGTICINLKNPHWNCKFTKNQSLLDIRGDCKTSYMEYHINVLCEYSPTISYGTQKGGGLVPVGKYSIIRFSTKTLSVFNEFERKWYKRDEHGNHILKKGRRIKIIPSDLVLTPLTLCIWFMDDGSCDAKRGSLTLETQSFTKAEVEFLISILKRDLNIDSLLKKAKNDQFRIRIPVSSYFDFLEIIKPHVEWDCFKYKLDDSYSKKPHRGENHSLHKLTEDMVKEIFTLSESGWSNKKIATKFNVTKSAVSLILSGKIWHHLGLKTSKPRVKKPRLSQKTKDEIFSMHKQKKFQIEIAKSLNISQSAVSRVLAKENHA